jgi:hypothetical protein
MTRAAGDAASGLGHPGALTEPPRPTSRSRRAIWIGAGGALLAAVFLALRYRLALTPLLAETYYDEALTGLMAFAILHGIPQVFYWGEPYGGAIGDAYPAAIGFRLFGPSTLVLRMAAAVIAVVWVWALWFVAHRAGARRFALLAGLLVAVPPIFLSYAQLSTHGESSALALATVALASAVSLIQPGSTRARAFTWALLGVASGLAGGRPDRRRAAPGIRSRPAGRAAHDPHARPLLGRRVVLSGELAVLDVERATTGPRSASAPGADRCRRGASGPGSWS